MTQKPDFEGRVNLEADFSQPLPLDATAQLVEGAEDAGLEEWGPEVNLEGDIQNFGLIGEQRALKIARVAKLKAKEPGLTYRQIGIRVGLAASTVARIVKKFAWDVDAKDLMKVQTFAAIGDWATARGIAASRGKHEAARDWLLYSGAIEPVAANAGASVQVGVQVVVAPTPGSPGYTQGVGTTHEEANSVPAALSGSSFPSSELMRGEE